MENPEEVLQSLDEFAKLKPKDIPRELEDYLSYVAKTGDPVYQWSIVKCLFREKLLNVITDFYETTPTIDLPPCPNVDPFNYETMKNSLLERLDSFPSAPFTVQRLCELLTTPRKEYSRADKFMRAIEKNILVVSTREPGNARRSDSNGQSELLMNGVMDGRGIELSEAIETVSSDGVNMTHAAASGEITTENENVVPVECAGMEEIDMEDHGDNTDAVATNSGAWNKEHSDTSVQDEEGEIKSYDGDVDGEDKPKDTPDTAEERGEEKVDNRVDSAELSTVTENVEVSELVASVSNVETTISVENKLPVDTPVEDSSGEDVDNVEPDSIAESSSSTVEERELKPHEEPTESSLPAVEELTEKMPSEEKESVEEDTVDSSSNNETLVKNIVSTEDQITNESADSNDEAVAKDVTSDKEEIEKEKPASSELSTEVVSSSVEDNSEIDSPKTEIIPEETSASSTEADILSIDSSAVTSDTAAATVGIDLTQESPQEVVTSSEAVDETTNQKETTEEIDVIPQSIEQVPVENTPAVISKVELEVTEPIARGDLEVTEPIARVELEVTEPIARVELEVTEPVSTKALPSEEEAMEVDEAVCTEMTDAGEPMDQSEEPTEQQLES